jgi:hypothetical protein
VLGKGQVPGVESPARRCADTGLLIPVSMAALDFLIADRRQGGECPQELDGHSGQAVAVQIPVSIVCWVEAGGGYPSLQREPDAMQWESVRTGCGTSSS